MPGWWSRLFGRRSRAVAELLQTVEAPAAEPVAPEPVIEAEPEPEVEPESDPPTDPATDEPPGREISPARLEAALQRLRQEIPASSEESSQGPSE